MKTFLEKIAEKGRRGGLAQRSLEEGGVAAGIARVDGMGERDSAGETGRLKKHPANSP